MKFKIGSEAFFSDIEGFEPHDHDRVLFEDNPILYKTFAYIKGKTEEVFAYKIMTKEEFLEFELEHCKKLPMAVGKLLVPEIADYFGITIDELKQFQFAIDAIDERHTYEKIIYDSYMKNKKFKLTKKQRQKAYDEYLKNKKLK